MNEALQYIRIQHGDIVELFFGTPEQCERHMAKHQYQSKKWEVIS